MMDHAQEAALWRAIGDAEGEIQGLNNEITRLQWQQRRSSARSHLGAVIFVLMGFQAAIYMMTHYIELFPRGAVLEASCAGRPA